MSRYTNYVMKNNVFAELYAPISSLATTIQLKSWQWARRGNNFPILATLENVDNTGKVQKREIVKITARSGDYLTVVRGFAACPANDDANSQGTTTFSFEADDRINMYVPKEIFDKIADTINDIYENGLDKLRVDVVSGLQIHVGAGAVLVGSSYYDFAGDNVTLTDNATNYVEIDEDGDLVVNTSAWWDKNTKIAKVSTSGWAVTNIEDRRLGTVWGKIWGVNIHDLTDKDILTPDDEFIVADSENLYQNKKIKAKNILWYDNGAYWETIQKWDIISKQNMMKWQNNFTANIWDLATQTKLSFMVFGSGKIWDVIYLYLSKTGSPSWYGVRIETDNNGEPSGILADANATGTIDTSNLTNTLTLTKIEFNWDFTLIEWQKYWVVISCTTVSASDYITMWFSTTNWLWQKIYNGANWTALKWEQMWYQPNIGNGSMSANVNFNIYLRPYSTIKMTQCCQKSAPNGTVNIQSLTITNTDTSEVVYTGTGDSMNITLIWGTKYNLTGKYVTGNRYTEYNNESGAQDVWCWKMRGSLIAYAAWPTGTCWYFKWETDICAEASSWLISDVIYKVDTTDIKTFSDIIWVAQDDWIAWDYKNIVINWWYIENDSRDLVPWQEYYYTNNTMQATAANTDTKIAIWKATTPKTIKVDIKIALVILYAWWNVKAPFTWLVIQQMRVNSFTYFKVDNVQHYISCAVTKWQTILAATGNIETILTKNR